MKFNPLLLLVAQGFAAVAAKKAGTSNHKKTGKYMTSATDPTPQVIWGDCKVDVCTYYYWTKAGTRQIKAGEDRPQKWDQNVIDTKCPKDTKCKSTDCLATKEHEVSCNVAGKNKRNIGGKKKRNVGRGRKHQLRNRI